MLSVCAIFGFSWSLMILGVRFEGVWILFLIIDAFWLFATSYCCRLDFWPTTQVVRLVGLARIEQAETLEVSGGTHDSCGIILTRV